MNPVQRHLKDLIRHNGPVSVEHFMSLAVAYYYTHHEPFGRDGDFTTAPEISQMFGEMLGICLADAWLKMGSPSKVILGEAGPGRGTLMADLLRATKHVPGFHDAIQIHLIEISPGLREKQKAALSGTAAFWHDDLDTLPHDLPILCVANEFLDALPIRQIQMMDGVWRERAIALNEDDDFIFGLIPSQVTGPGTARHGGIFEFSPAREDWTNRLAVRLKQQKGLALLIDYGHDQTDSGDTLQAVRNHKFIDILTDIGDADLTSHVDFAALKEKAGSCVAIHGPIGQGDFLEALGIGLRAARLGRQADALRLTSGDQMGRLFKVMALCSDETLKPAGF